MIIFVVLCMTVLIGFAGLGADTGMVWISRARLQNSVDAAVLAAAQELPASDATTKAGATSVACNFATVHDAVPGMFGKLATPTCSGKADVTFPDSTTVRVTAYRTVQPIFGQVLGFASVEVSAQATAKVGSLGASCIFPFYITKSQLTASPTFFAPIKFTNANTAGGAIDVGGGANGVRDAMSATACASSPPASFEGTVGQTVTTKPGALDQFKDGWDTIATAAATSSCPDKHVSTYLTQDAAGRYELLPTITRTNCPRLIVIPVLDGGKIAGFIPFYFALKCDENTCDDPDVGAMTRNDFWGYYVRLDLTSLKYSDYQPEFGTQIVSLSG